MFGSDFIVLQNGHPAARLFADRYRDEANADIPAKKTALCNKVILVLLLLVA